MIKISQQTLSMLERHLLPLTTLGNMDFKKTHECESVYYSAAMSW